MDERAIAEALERPAAYVVTLERKPDRVEHRETHISHLFFAGSRVFKLKKHVRLDFLDYGTLERRRFCCEEEVRLNRRLAPGIYEGVVAVTRDGKGVLRVEGAGRPVAFAVKMVRLPAEGMLENVLGDELEGGLSRERVRALARTLARFHAEAATGPAVDAHASPEAVAQKTLDNLEQVEPFLRNPLSVPLHRIIHGHADDFLSRRRQLLARRVDAGRIREGHGDLHASNVCFVPETLVAGGVAIYDCIEFSARLRCGDVASDVAFLAMDLDRRGHARTSDRLIGEYVERAGDPELVELMCFYKSYRAMVRAKVAALAARDGVPDDVDPEEKNGEARGYQELAASYALPPGVVLTCGLPASGKSWLARHLAGRIGAVVLRSDVVRKRLAGLEPNEPAPAAFGEGLYDDAMTRRTYDELLDRALDLVRAGRNVIVDASFSSRRRRAPFVRAVEAEGRPLHVLSLTAPEAVVRERLMRRDGGSGGGPSDAGLAVWRAARETFEPADELRDRRLRVVSGVSDPADVAAWLLERRNDGRGGEGE